MSRHARPHEQRRQRGEVALGKDSVAVGAHEEAIAHREAVELVGERERVVEQLDQVTAADALLVSVLDVDDVDPEARRTLGLGHRAQRCVGEDLPHGSRRGGIDLVADDEDVRAENPGRFADGKRVGSGGRERELDEAIGRRPRVFEQVALGGDGRGGELSVQRHEQRGVEGRLRHGRIGRERRAKARVGVAREEIVDRALVGATELREPRARRAHREGRLDDRAHRLEPTRVGLAEVDEELTVALELGEVLEHLLADFTHSEAPSSHELRDGGDSNGRAKGATVEG